METAIHHQPRSMNSTGISRHEHRSKCEIRQNRTLINRPVCLASPCPRELILPACRQLGNHTAGGRAQRHAPRRGTSTPPSRRGRLPGARRRTAAACTPAPDTVPNTAAPGVHTHQAAPTAEAGGGGRGSWRRPTEARGERERGVSFLGFLEGQLWESFEVWCALRGIRV